MDFLFTQQHHTKWWKTTTTTRTRERDKGKPGRSGITGIANNDNNNDNDGTSGEENRAYKKIFNILKDTKTTFSDKNSQLIRFYVFKVKVNQLV